MSDALGAARAHAGEADWSGRTAIVTGASGGIGRAVAQELAGRGAQLALLARDEDRLAEVAASCRRLAPDHAAPPWTATVDLADADALTDAAAAAVEACGGRVTLLANVAGSSLRHARLEELDDADWQANLALNLLAAVRLQRACFEPLREARGAVVNVGSIVAGSAAVLGAPYAAAKAALASVTRSTALEWARHGIRAVTIEPGYVATDFNRRLVEAGLEERMLARVPTRRPIDPAAVARLVVFAGSPEQVDLTGATLTLDGGATARL